jgi:hypothetical protein
VDSVNPEFAFSSVRDAAIQLRGAASAAGVDLHPLPYSRFNPDDTTWWLSPVGDNPAFAFGKIVVEPPTVAHPGAVLVGLHVEKGVGPSAAGIFEETARGRRLVMERGWLWHPFARAMRSGELDRGLAVAEQAAAGLPLIVEVVASLQWPPKLDGDEDRPIDPDGVERAWYRPEEGSLTLLGMEAPKLLSTLGVNETLASIAAKISAIDHSDWVWVEIMMGVPLVPVPSNGLTAADVWRRACTPWLGWVR